MDTEPDLTDDYIEPLPDDGDFAPPALSHADLLTLVRDLACDEIMDAVAVEIDDVDAVPRAILDVALKRAARKLKMKTSGHLHTALALMVTWRETAAALRMYRADSGDLLALNQLGGTAAALARPEVARRASREVGRQRKEHAVDDRQRERRRAAERAGLIPAGHSDS